MNQKLWEETSNYLTLQATDKLESENHGPDAGLLKPPLHHCHPRNDLGIPPTQFPLGCSRISGVLRGSIVWTTGAGDPEGPFEEELWHHVHPESSHSAWPSAKPDKRQKCRLADRRSGSQFTETPVPKRHRVWPLFQPVTNAPALKAGHFAPLLPHSQAFISLFWC